jgi:hypothetical protein
MTISNEPQLDGLVPNKGAWLVMNVSDALESNIVVAFMTSFLSHRIKHENENKIKSADPIANPDAELAAIAEFRIAIFPILNVPS